MRRSAACRLRSRPRWIPAQRRWPTRDRLRVSSSWSSAFLPGPPGGRGNQCQPHGRARRSSPPAPRRRSQRSRGPQLPGSCQAGEADWVVATQNDPFGSGPRRCADRPEPTPDRRLWIAKQEPASTTERSQGGKPSQERVPAESGAARGGVGEAPGRVPIVWFWCGRLARVIDVGGAGQIVERQGRLWR
jgi:hypothetical protein